MASKRRPETTTTTLFGSRTYVFSTKRWTIRTINNGFFFSISPRHGYNGETGGRERREEGFPYFYSGDTRGQ